MVAKSGPICQRRSTHCMRLPLRSTEQIYLVFLIPTLISCAVYMVNFAADFVVAIQHFGNDDPIWGSCTFGIMYAPAVAYFVLTVSRPDWWMSEEEKITKGIVTWFILQILQLFLFPIFVLYRFAGLIVLVTDAIMLSGYERTKTLDIAAKPAAIELYFFLQAWFQAAPQAMFQSRLLFNKDHYTDRTHQSIIAQLICILMSIVVLSIQTMQFQRFESQKINGRKLPWAMWLKKYREQELQEITADNKPTGSTTTLLKSTETHSELKSVDNTSKESEESMKKNEVKNGISGLERQISVTPPLPPKNAHATPPPTPLRGVTIVTPLKIPDMPAPPRPDSMANIDEEEVRRSSEEEEEEEEGTADKEIYRFASFRLPKRKYSQKGLEEDDPIGKTIAFLWWFLFISPRILAIAMAYEFNPEATLAVLFVHYLLMLCYLFYNAKENTVITFFINIWLGFVYIVAAIEYKVKYKYADKWLVVYYIFVILQNTGLTLLCYLNNADDNFWYNLIVYLIFGSMGLCIVSTTTYHLLFKPSKKRVYVT